MALALSSAACVPGTGDEDAGPTSPWAMVFEGLPGALLSVTGTASDAVWIVGADKRDGNPAAPSERDIDFQRRFFGDAPDVGADEVVVP